VNPRVPAAGNSPTFQLHQLLAGALNVGLLLLNARDGLVLSGRLWKRRPQAGIERLVT